MKLLKDKIAQAGIIVLIIVVIPSLIFSIYQYGKLSSGEKVIDDVYKNQLEAILFSINQHSTDVLDSWVYDLNRITYNKDSTDNLKGFVLQRKQIIHLSIYKQDKLQNPKFTYTDDDTNIDINKREQEYIANNPQQIEQLISFLKNDYQKIHGFHIANDVNLSGFIFALRGNSDSEPYIGVIVINSRNFVSEILSPKIQEVAQDKMKIVVYHNTKENIIYQNLREIAPQIQKSKELWLMPNYHLGIELIGDTLEDLTQKRTKTILLLVLLFNILVIASVVYLIRNIRKEIELAKIKSDFVSNVSHEIRTPLAMISMFTETLQMNRIKDESKKHEYYNIIFQETQRLTGIVNNILNFSKIDNNKRTYQFSRMSINSIVENVMASHKYNLEQKGFTYSIELHTSLDKIEADKDAIADAIINLLSNAIKYSETNKHITIKTGSEKHMQYIAVTDKGIGIPKKEQKYIFDKFFRVTTGNLAHTAEGSGLGLSIVKHIVDAHNGTIQVESVEGQGTTFSLYFPVNQKS